MKASERLLVAQESLWLYAGVYAMKLVSALPVIDTDLFSRLNVACHTRLMFIVLTCTEVQ